MKVDKNLEQNLDKSNEKLHIPVVIDSKKYSVKENGYVSKIIYDTDDINDAKNT